MSIANQAAVTAALASCMAASSADRAAEPGSLPGWAWFPVAAFAVFAVVLLWARSPRA